MGGPEEDDGLYLLLCDNGGQSCWTKVNTGAAGGADMTG